MLRILAGPRHSLHDTAATRALEQQAALSLPSHTMMARAGLAAAKLARALEPHAQTVWVACGPGNNGGDGWEAAAHLRRSGLTVIVTPSGDETKLPADALQSRTHALQTGVNVSEQPPEEFDLCIDALLGIGAQRPPAGDMARWIERMNASSARILALDVPSGLHPDTGAAAGPLVHARDTLSFLTLKPGLFTAHGRDASGTVWLDRLGLDASVAASPASAWLLGRPDVMTRPHASHKGSYGDVAIVGGAAGMAGAAVLAGRAALHGGAGRVMLALLDEQAATLDMVQPELMLRSAASLDFKSLAVVCGCGGGDAVRALLPRVLSTARQLVLDADALNAIAGDTQLQEMLGARGRRGQPTVMTPHPLEAARLLGTDTATVQAERLQAAKNLAGRFGCVAVLKGSGTVVAAPGELPCLNPTGNARLASGGTGDVLAGMIGACLAQGDSALDAACRAVYLHGSLADHWPAGDPLTASKLARRSG